jgi:hypothetical protein
MAVVWCRSTVYSTRTVDVDAYRLQNRTNLTSGMIRRTNPTERLSHFTRKSSFLPLRLLCGFDSKHLTWWWEVVRSFGAKVAKTLIKFDQAPTWHLPCLAGGLFGTGIVDTILIESIKGVRMRGAV